MSMKPSGLWRGASVPTDRSEALLLQWTGRANSSQVVQGGALFLADCEPLVALVGKQPVSSSQQQTDWERACWWGAGRGE